MSITASPEAQAVHQIKNHAKSGMTGFIEISILIPLGNFYLKCSHNVVQSGGIFKRSSFHESRGVLGKVLRPGFIESKYT